jgi:ADP-ribose pyrophosphatase YjhB (NUDIX family)
VTLPDAISFLHSQTSKGQDLPEELFLFISAVTPLVNVDLLVKDDTNRTLLTWRDDEHYGAGWHVPGGIIRFKEHAQGRIQKVAQQELGCAVEAESVPLLVTENISDSRERGHFISFLYRCRIAGALDPGLEARNTPKRGQWRWFESPPQDLLPVHRVYAQFLQSSSDV